MASQDTEPLRQLYASQPDPAFGFDENLEVAWLNPACRQTLLSVAEGVYLPEVFPDFGLEAVKDRVREQGVGLFRNRRSGGETIAVTCYDREGAPFYVGSYRSFCAYRTGPEGAESAEGVRLLSYYARQRVFGLLNQLDILAQHAEDGAFANAADRIGRMEDTCLTLLKLCENLSLYYGREGTVVLQPVPMEDCLLRILHELEFRLIPLGLRIEYDVNCGGAVCLADRGRLEAGLLNLAAGTVHCFRQKGGTGSLLSCRCWTADGSVQLLLTDNCSDAADLCAQREPQLRLDSSGELLPLKRMGYDILERAVEDAGGTCILAGLSPGIQVMIRLPMEEDALRLRDEPAYTLPRSQDGRTSLMNVLLAGL